jgi:hypothetical protein
MRYRLLGISTIVLLGLCLFGYRFQPQKTAVIGSADASTDCDGSTDPTADLACVNTGTLTVGGFAQMTVSWIYTRGSEATGTYVNIQCDSKDADYDQWYLDPVCSATTCSQMTWTTAVTASTAFRHHFGANTELFRCRGWVTSGNADDLLQINVRVASTVGAR